MLFITRNHKMAAVVVPLPEHVVGHLEWHLLPEMKKNGFFGLNMLLAISDGSQHNKASSETSQKSPTKISSSKEFHFSDSLEIFVLILLVFL